MRKRNKEEEEEKEETADKINRRRKGEKLTTITVCDLLPQVAPVCAKKQVWIRRRQKDPLDCDERKKNKPPKSRCSYCQTQVLIQA